MGEAKERVTTQARGGAAKDTEEDGMTAGEPEGSGDMLTASTWGAQESGAGRLQGGARVGGKDIVKSPSVAADKEGTRGRHGARLGQGEKNGDRRENAGSVNSGVQNNNRGNEASGVAHESHGVEEGEEGHEASGVAEKPGVGCHGVGVGVEWPQGADTPGVAKEPRGDETPGGTTEAEDRPGEDGQGRGGRVSSVLRHPRSGQGAQGE